MTTSQNVKSLIKAVNVAKENCEYRCSVIRGVKNLSVSDLDTAEMYATFILRGDNSLYDKQFIRSDKGITPAVMVGDNNVWTGNGKYQRRARDWSVLGNNITVSEEQLLALAKSWTGGAYQEHWKQNGKWIDDAGLMRWMKNSIKSAASVEEIIIANAFNSIQCYLSVWIGDNHYDELRTYVHSTKEFDLWTEQVNARIAEIKSQKENHAFPIVKFTSEFDNEKLNHPRLTKAVKPEKVIIKNKGKYLTEFTKDDNRRVNSYSWESETKNAIEMSYDEAVAFVNDFGRWSGRAQIVNATKKLLPYNAIIKINGMETGSGTCDDMFVKKSTRSRITLSHTEAGAYHYCDEKSAARALKSLIPRLQLKNYGAEVVILE